MAKFSTQPHARLSSFFQSVPGCPRGVLRGAPVFHILVYITSVATVRIHSHARLAGLFPSVPGCPRDVPECSGVPGINTTPVLFIVWS